MSSYSEAAPDYWSRGWRGILPIRPRNGAPRKDPVPTGYSGYSGEYPSFADIMEWQELHSDPLTNLALRLPNTVVGIDVDNYGKKQGGRTLADAEARWGELPPTVRSTSRIDGTSGIRLYRIPAGTHLETLITGDFELVGDEEYGIEVCQFFHRYCVAWPSTHPDTGRTYQWLTAEGNVTGDLPRPGELPMLPQRWIDGLRVDQQSEPTVHANVSDVLSGLDDSPMSIKVQAALEKALQDLTGRSGTRHDTALANIGRLLRLHEQEEPGVGRALRSFRVGFISVVGMDRGVDDARREFDRMLEGNRIHDKIASTPSTNSGLAALMGPGAIVPTLRALATAGADADTYVTSTDDDDDWDFFEAEKPEPADDIDAFLFGDEPLETGASESKTSWGPMDLELIISGDYEPEVPGLFARSDGQLLLYPGRVNGLVGESESGKSWIALIATAQILKNGGKVFYLDFEDTPESVVGRLKYLGVTEEELLAGLAYAAPDTALDQDGQEDLARTLDRMRPDLIPFDGLNAAATLMRLDINSTTEMTSFFQLVLKPLCRHGSAVLTIDHVSKDADSRGGYAIGSQAKKATCDGVLIGVRASVPFGRGRCGELEMIILKDKHGGVRAIAESRKIGQKGYSVDYLASVTIDATNDDRMHTEVLFKKGDDGNSGGNSDDPLILNRINVSNYVRDNPGAKSTDIYGGVKGRKDAILGAIKGLVQDGYLRSEKGDRGAVHHYHVRPYTGPDVDEFLGLNEEVPGGSE